MFGMRITVWRNVKLHAKSIISLLIFFSMMSFVQSAEVNTEASIKEKDWVLLMIGMLMALSVFIWLVYLG
jgi:hypothetical protein